MTEEGRDLESTAAGTAGQTLMLRLLLWARLRSFVNGLTRTAEPEKRRSQRGLVFTLLVGVAVGMLGYTFVEPFASASSSDPQIRLLLARAPAIGLFSSFWLLVLSGVTAGIQTFYLNPEIGLLLASPSRPGPFFVAKLVEATMTNAALFVSTAAPLLVGYGLALDQFTLSFAVILLLVLVAFSALPTGIGVLASMLLMRILPAGRTRDALAAAGVALFALAYFALSTGATRMNHADVQALRSASDRLLAAVSSPLLRHGPWAWGGDLLGGDLSAADAVLRIALLMALAAGSVILCGMVAPSLFFPGWSAAQEADSSSREPAASGRPRSMAPPLRAVAGLLPAPARAVFVKDMLSLTRDMRQLSMLFIPIAVIAVFIANLRSSPPESAFGSVLFVQTLLVILAPISLRLSLAAYVAENRAFWLALAAPNPPWTIMIGKFAFALSLSLPLGLLAAGAYAWATDLAGPNLLLALAVTVSGLAAFSGIGVGASARFCDFTADNPRFTMTSAGRLAVFGLQIVFLLAFGALNLGGWVLIRLGAFPQVAVMLAQAIGGAILSAACAGGMLAWGAVRLRKMEWQ